MIKNFGITDVTNSDSEYPRIYYTKDELIYFPLWWQEKGLQYTASGYGSKIPTPYKISWFGREYRVYCTIFGNSGTSWFKVLGKKIYVA